MRIKKHGKFFEKEPVNNIEKFVCENCDCEFNCKDDEYYVDFSGADTASWLSSSITYHLSAVTKDYLVCSCPECHKIVKKIRERKNETYWTTTTAPLTTVQLDPDTTKTEPYRTKEWVVTCNSSDAVESLL